MEPGAGLFPVSEGIKAEPLKRVPGHFLKKPNPDRERWQRGVREGHGPNAQLDPPVLLPAGQNWG